MSEMKFHKAFPFIRDEHNENVCRVITETSFVPQRDLTPFEIDARMNLLAAGPELLAALKFVHEHIADPERGFRDLYPAFGLDSRRAIDMVSTAIAKAEGRAA